MPRPSSKTKPITIYPPIALVERIEALAEADGRRTANMAVKLLSEHPELKEALNGRS